MKTNMKINVTYHRKKTTYDTFVSTEQLPKRELRLCEMNYTCSNEDTYHYFFNSFLFADIKYKIALYACKQVIIIDQCTMALSAFILLRMRTTFLVPVLLCFIIER